MECDSRKFIIEKSQDLLVAGIFYAEMYQPDMTEASHNWLCLGDYLLV